MKKIKIRLIYLRISKWSNSYKIENNCKNAIENNQTFDINKKKVIGQVIMFNRINKLVKP